MITTNRTVVDDYVPCPQRYGVPLSILFSSITQDEPGMTNLLNLEALLALFVPGFGL